MGRLTIEAGPTNAPFDCACCGKRSQSIHGFVSRDGDAHAVYFAGWSEGHRDLGLTALVSIGDWGGDDADPGTRRSVGLRIWAEDDRYNFEVIDAGGTTWADKKDLLGAMLTRDQALALAEIGDYYHVAEHVLDDDERVRAFFSAAS